MRRLDDVIVDADDVRQLRHGRLQLASASGSCCRAGVEAAVLAHERGRCRDPPSLVRSDVLVVVPTQAHRVGLLIDEHEVLLAVAASPSSSTTGMFPMNCRGCGGEQSREPLERVRGSERGVLGVGCEHIEPPALDELARIGHVPGAQRVELHEIREPLPVVSHARPRDRLGRRGGEPRLRELYFRETETAFFRRRLVSRAVIGPTPRIFLMWIRHSRCGDIVESDAPSGRSVGNHRGGSDRARRGPPCCSGVRSPPRPALPYRHGNSADPPAPDRVGSACGCCGTRR